MRQIILRCAEQSQQIRIGDINDNSPIFAKSEASLEIEENVPIGSILTQVKATDADSSENFGKIRFRLIGSDNFEIDEQSGVIRVAKVIDYEQQAKYNVSYDQGLAFG